MIKKRVKTSILLLCFAFFSSEIFANEDEALIKKIEFSSKKIEIEISKKSDFKIFTLENPDRLVIDIKNADFAKDYEQNVPSFISSIRKRKSDSSLRIAFDLKQKIFIEKLRFEKIQKQKYGKIVAEISMTPSAAKISSAQITTSKDEKIKTADSKDEKVKAVEARAEEPAAVNQDFDVKTTKVINEDGSAKYIVKKTPKPKKIPIIVIDAGHGGKDPGTIGNFARTKEKNLTLSYAKELTKQLNNTKLYKAYLTRDTDDFIALRQRVAKARKRKADLFISLHANSISDKSISGFSIYTLSEKSSDKQAELLAQKENRADIIAGVDFADASADIMKTLIDLSQRESKNASSKFANLAIQLMQKSKINILENTHRFAGFAVLTAPDMASVLIELGYLSNKSEEKLLNSPSYKRKVTENLVFAINEFFSNKK